MKKNYFGYIIMVLAMVTIYAGFSWGMKVVTDWMYYTIDASETVNNFIILVFLTGFYQAVKNVWNKMKAYIIK